MGQEWEPVRKLHYSAVSWLHDWIDLRPMGGPEAVITSDDDRDLAMAWHIPRPFDSRTHATLIVHARRGNGNDGGVIALAISEFVVIRDTDNLLIPPKPMDMKLLSSKRTDTDDAA